MKKVLKGKPVNKKYLLPIIFVGLVLAITVIYFNRSKVAPLAFTPTKTTTQLATLPAGTEEVVAENLKIPWEVAFLPDGTMLVTERTGTLKHITSATTAVNVEGVVHKGEGGLLGMALHPDFKDNHFIYLYSTTATGGGLTNRVERYVYNNEQLSDRKVLLEGIPGSSNHDGGRLAFGPDGDLYITTGDAENSANAQDQNSLAGKILRLKDDGSIPEDNPFHNATYSYGHRNPQGLAWDTTGQLWATEHGPSGLQTGYDELNRIEKGANYGWPTIKGSEAKDGLITPVLNSGSKETWAPSGMAFYKGLLIFSGLRGESLYSTPVANGQVGTLTSYLHEKYGRLRAVVAGPDGFLYITTSNTDGRGTPKSGDDKVIRIKPNF
ncbi:MAG TPA: PQQ-dependent sugar dehydrogenase [Patescibacteria group bacterium]|jgi:glucose/arabinose dehydrogenase|nr:PQQ-dependent sugar dehydrogenase [Patescibacteria group bacterium]